MCFEDLTKFIKIIVAKAQKSKRNSNDALNNSVNSQLEV
jgi:hypothetical protein